MFALFFLEAAYLRHEIAAIGRSPLRLAAWIPYVLFIAYVTLTRFTAGHGRHVVLGPGALFTFAPHPDFETGAAGLYVALVGVAAGAACAGAITPFRNAAEPILFLNAGVRSLTLAVWLQLRRIGAGWVRSFSTLIYVLLFYWPARTDEATTLRSFASAILAFSVLISLQLPAFLLARGRRKAAATCVAWTIAIVGATYAVAGFAGDRFRRPLIAATQLDPGLALRALLAGNCAVLLALLAIFALMVATVAALGGDVLPELYVASHRALARRQQVRTADGALPSRRPRIGKSRVPAGALALIWKDWITFRRVGGSQIFWFLTCAFWAGCGAGAALLARHYHDPAPLAVLVVILGLFVILFVPLGASLALADDLGKPLFWLSPVALRVRLAASTFARAWRVGIALGLAPLAVGTVFGDIVAATISLPAGVITSWALLALGVGLYALFPNPLDARGPIGALRTLVTVACFIPPALVAAIVAMLHGHLAELGIAFAVTLVCEGWLAIELAAFRLREGGAAMATAAR